MAQFHLPRFRRTPAVAPIHLTARDLEILRLIHWHRFLRSSQIITLIGGSPQQLLRRLQLLYHHGFLERPRAQLEYYHFSGSQPYVYGIGNKGASILYQDGYAIRSIRWGEKNRSVGRIYLQHFLSVSYVMVDIELACRRNGHVQLLAVNDLPNLKMSGHHNSFRWRVKINSDMRLGVVPDRAFGLEYPDEKGESKRAFFFLEADRGTMPVVRKNLFQTSLLRKLLAYEATWAQGLHQSQFGFHRFRVLITTKSSERVKSLVDACSQLKRGHGLFLFADMPSLQKHGDILTFPWQTGRTGEVSRLLD